MLQAFGESLSKRKQRWVIILDPPIHIKKGYYPYDSGIKENVFMQDITGKPYVGQVTPRALLATDVMRALQSCCCSIDVLNLPIAFSICKLQLAEGGALACSAHATCQSSQRHPGALCQSASGNQGAVSGYSGVVPDIPVFFMQLWPGATHWPDFMNPATWTWWMDQIQVTSPYTLRDTEIASVHALCALCQFQFLPQLSHHKGWKVPE